MEVLEEMTAVEEYLALALIEKTKELIRKERLTLELFEILDSRMRWLSRFCQTNGIQIPNQEQIVREEERIKYLMGEIGGISPNGSKQPNEPNEDDYRTCPAKTNILLPSKP